MQKNMGSNDRSSLARRAVSSTTCAGRKADPCLAAVLGGVSSIVGVRPTPAASPLLLLRGLNAGKEVDAASPEAVGKLMTAPMADWCREQSGRGAPCARLGPA